MHLIKMDIKIPILLLAISVFFLLGCDDEHAQQNKDEWSVIDSVQITERVHDAEIVYTDSGKLRAKLTAPLIEGHKNAEKPYIELTKGLQADFYNDAKEVESSLTAGYGINYQNSKIIEVQKQVVVVNTKGEKLVTEQLFWDQNTKEIYTDKTVKITTNTEELTGTGMRAAQDFSSWKITHVIGIVTLK